MNNKIIDLHGKDEIEATKIILMAIMDFENGSISSLEIITGNGGTLRRVLENILEDEGYSWHHKNNNLGSYIIKK